jgi:hypothetical protein
VIHRDIDTVAEMAEDLFSKYQGGQGASIDDAVKASLREQATKRVAIQFEIEDTVSWDHAKLGGTY